MMTQDELVALFQQRLSLQQMPVMVSPKEQAQIEQPRVYSITQHYHHSAHIGSRAPSSATSDEPTSDDKGVVERALCGYGVDIRVLDPSQIELFQTADAEQQRRLIQLWRICASSRDDEAVEQARPSSSTKPYMTAGYEAFSLSRCESAVGIEAPKYSHATDPAYRSTQNFCGDWSALVAQRQLTLGSHTGPQNAHAFYGFVDEDEEMCL